MIDDFNREVGFRIRALRLELGLTLEELGEKVNLNKSTVKRYEDGNIKTLSVDNLKSFADALNTYPGYLMGLKSFSAGESKKPLKVYGRICAGNGLTAFEDELDEIICPYPSVKGELIALQVEGESMNRIIPHGVYSIIKLQPTIENGQIAAVIIDNEDAMLKRFYRVDEETVMLKPESTEAYEPRVFVGEEINQIKIVGKHIGFVSPYVGVDKNGSS